MVSQNIQERFFWNARVCYALIARDMLIFKKTCSRRLINTAAWTVVLVYAFEYIGLSTSVGWGLFIACSEYASQGFYRVFSYLMALLGDLKGPRTISYYLTLPVSHTVVFLSIIISAALRLLIMVIPVPLVAKCVLGSAFDLSRVSFCKVGILTLCIHLFYGTLLLLYASLVNSIEGVYLIRVRIADMLFWMGAFYFTWERLYQKSLVVAYLDLLNPLVYGCEGMRAAIMGQTGSLPFWLCCVALLCFAAVSGTVAVYRMKRKLDCL